MRKQFLIAVFGLSAFLIAALTFAQTPDGSETPSPTPLPMLVSTATPKPSPPPSVTISPGDVGTVAVPPSLSSPSASPLETPSATPIEVQAAALGEADLGWSERGAPVFTIEQAVLTALQHNPAILEALQEIRRTKGVILQITAQALPQIGPNFDWQWHDPNLRPTTGVPKPVRDAHPDIAYTIQVIGTQEIVNYSNWRAIRGTFFQRDSAYFALRNTVDSTISTVKTEFYQVVVNRELIVVQEQSVALLDSQLKDQQNRFEAGTVPRFNVLQAQVQLYNQIPQLIAARNNYRISVLQLAKTLGLDFHPSLVVTAPLRVRGTLNYVERHIDLAASIEEGKRNRPSLKKQRADVLNQIEQVHVAIGSWLPTVNATGGGEWLSNESGLIGPGGAVRGFNSGWGDVSKGWLTTVTGSWPIWDSGMAWGKIKQQRAILSQQEIIYDDDARQVELEIQQAASNTLQFRDQITATEKNLESAAEAVRLAKARLDAGAGTQLDVLNAQVQLTTAQSTNLQALFGYISALAEFDRATGAQSTYSESFDNIAPHSTRSRTYYTGSDVDARGRPKPVTGWESTTTTTTTTRVPAGK